MRSPTRAVDWGPDSRSPESRSGRTRTKAGSTRRAAFNRRSADCTARRSARIPANVPKCGLVQSPRAPSPCSTIISIAWLAADARSVIAARLRPLEASDDDLRPRRPRRTPHPRRNDHTGIARPASVPRKGRRPSPAPRARPPAQRHRRSAGGRAVQRQAPRHRPAAFPRAVRGGKCRRACSPNGTSASRTPDGYRRDRIGKFGRSKCGAAPIAVRMFVLRPRSSVSCFVTLKGAVSQACPRPSCSGVRASSGTALERELRVQVLAHRPCSISRPDRAGTQALPRFPPRTAAGCRITLAGLPGRAHSLTRREDEADDDGALGCRRLGSSSSSS